MIGWIFYWFTWLTIFPPNATGQDFTEPVPKSLLIQNVTLIDQGEQIDDALVAILILDGRLDLITKDTVSAKTAGLTLDAQKGILLGKLIADEPANFVILDRDPREDFQALLDTATHTTFAIKDGKIVRNWLIRISQDEQAYKRSDWLAYTPPPLALPSPYKETDKWNKWETRYISGLFQAAMALDRQDWVSQDNTSKAQVGDLKDSDGGEVRAFRIGMVGTLNFPEPWGYLVAGTTNAFDKGFDSKEDDEWQLFDWRLDIPLLADITLSIGKQKEPISLERMMGLIYLPLQERSVVADAMFPARNVGMVLSGMGFDQRMTWAGGAFNNWLDPDESGSIKDNATQFVGRVTGLPFISADESHLLHLGFGLRYTNAKENLQFGSTPEFDQAPFFVDTGNLTARNSLLYNFEVSWRGGPFWFLGEYSLNDVKADDLGNPDFRGYRLTGSWTLTGEMRGYNRRSGVFNPLPVSRSVYQKGWGAWEVAARWSDLDLTDGLVKGGEVQIASLGVNWWLSSFLEVTCNYRWVWLDRFGVDGDSSGFNFRILVILE